MDYVTKKAKSELSKSVQQVKDYVSAHLNEKIAVHDIAKELKLNASYLNTCFKMETGECITHYIQKCKISKAQEMLKSCRYTIAEIGSSLSFFDQSHFNKCFKKITGLTPRQFKLRHGQRVNKDA